MARNDYPAPTGSKRSQSGGVVILATLLGTAAAALAQDIRYEKYELPNGMTVILHEDHKVPVVAVNTWYRVGSKDERERRSGFAHLFEHLMFMGTERVPNGEFDAIMETAGGSNNASTGEDTTNYFSSGPASLLPTLLWLDADRLEDLGRMMDQAKLDRQREVVRNERRQSYENQPYGRADLVVSEMMFPPGHPYHWPVIGSHADLEAATVSDVKDFFATYYVPNNASLCVAGDFDPARIKSLIAELFGTLPRGAPVARRAAEPVKLAGVKRVTMLDQVQLPMVEMVFHSPARFAPGDAELDLAAGLLAEGKTSRLYKRLVYDDHVAVDVSADQNSMQLGSLFHVTVMAKPDADLDRIEAMVDEELAKFCAEAPATDELARRKATTELSMLSRLEGLDAKADLLNLYEYYFHEPNSFARDLDRYRQATPESVQQWAKAVLTPDARLILRVLPEQTEHKPSARDRRPGDLPLPAFGPAEPESFVLSSGVHVLLWHKSELPLVALDMLFHPGGTLDGVEEAGRAALMAAMLGEGAGALDALQFGDAVQQLGATFGAGADHESVEVTMTVLARNFAPATKLMADAICRPRMDPKEWERVQRLQVEHLREQEEEPEVVAGRVALRTLFGKQRPYGWPSEGTPETVAKLTLAEVRRAHDEFVGPGFATLLIAGDIAVADAKEVLERAFGEWRTREAAARPRSEAAPATPGRLRIVIADDPGAVQTVIYWIEPGPKYADAQRVQYRMLNTILGGSFTSRLVQNLREAHGYTYGVHSNFVMEPSLGYFTIVSSVQSEVAGPAVAELMNELRRIRSGDISADEASKAGATLRAGTIKSLAGLSGLLDIASDPIAAGVPFDAVMRDYRATNGVTAEALNQLAKTAINVDGGVLVLVGDKEGIAEQIKPLGLPAPAEVSVRGDAVGGPAPVDSTP